MKPLKKANKKEQKNKKNPYLRQDWKQLIQEALQVHGNETTDAEWLNAPLTDDSDWKW